MEHKKIKNTLIRIGLLLVGAILTFLVVANYQKSNNMIEIVGLPEKNELSSDVGVRIVEITVDGKKVDFSKLQLEDGWSITEDGMLAFYNKEKAIAQLIPCEGKEIAISFLQQNCLGKAEIRTSNSIITFDTYKNTEWNITKVNVNISNLQHYSYEFALIFCFICLGILLINSIYGIFTKREQKNVYKLKNEIEKSVYLKFVRNTTSFIILSLLISIICTIITYPGILYSDSFARINLYYVINDSIKKLFSGQRQIINASAWMTLTPSYFITMCINITGNVAMYTFFQAFLFIYLSLLLVKRLATKYKNLQYVILLVNPIIWGVCTYYEPGIGCICGITILVLILTKHNIIQNKIDKILDIICIVFGSFITFGYRANSFTIIPVLLVAIFLYYKDKLNRIKNILALLLGLILVSAIPKVMNINTMSSLSAGFVWEILSTIQNMEEEDKEKYITYLDEVGGEGATKDAIKVNNFDNVNGWLWSTKLDTYNLSKEGNSKIIINKYIQLALNEPIYFLNNKVKFIKRTLGIGKPLILSEYNYDYNNYLKDFGWNTTVQRNKFIDIYTDFLDSNLIFRIPIVIFIVSALLLLFLKLKKKRLKFEMFLFFIAIFYYLAFLINNQSFEYRYFFPSLYLLLIMDVSIIVNNINFGIIKFRGDKNDLR